MRSAQRLALGAGALLLVGCTTVGDPAPVASPDESPAPVAGPDELAAPTCELGPAPEEPDPEVAADPVEFDVAGEVAVMTGVMGADFVHRVCDLTASYPDVAEIEMFDVPGQSTPGNETLQGGLVLRSQGLDTFLPSDGIVESGGVDFFLAGAEREVADGGCLGVHSTEIDYGDGPIAASDLPRDDPEHQPYLEYFAEIGIPTDFYWFTLEAAPPDGIHYLTPQEMIQFDVVTGEPPAQGCSLPDVG